MLANSLLFSSCTKTVDSNNSGTTVTDKCYLKVFDFTNTSTTYSTVIIGPDKKSYVFTPGIDTLYNEIPSGISLAKVEAFGTGYLYSPTSVNLSTGNFFTSFIYNQSNNVPGIGFIADDLTIPPPSYARVRVLYFLSPGATNLPTNVGIANATDTLMTYNRTDVDFVRVAPLTAFRPVKASIYSVYANNSVVGVISLTGGSIYTLVINKIANTAFAYTLYTNR
ncbi:MAG: hypothetical protein C0459_10990 [Chitinophaga sp.]|nr:hypothetical protein [Chitinophaga sp.]